MTDHLLPGDQAPYFHAAALDGNPRFTFDTVAGRVVVLLMAGSASDPIVARGVSQVLAHASFFDDDRACFFGVTVDPRDVAAGRIAQRLPGIRWFLDYDCAVSTRYGAITDRDAKSGYRPHWLVLDTTLRVASRHPIDQGEQAIASARALAAETDVYPAAPVLIVPRVIEPDLCRRLIHAYDADGGEESGFMREENGITVARLDHAHKRRSDYHIEDEALRDEVRARLKRFLLPQLRRAFQFEATRIERWLVACYNSAEGGGHFRAHRDNTTKGTAHRRFAVTINLNADEYDGGDLSFPEFGRRTYRAPTGGAVVFSCSLLHEARRVTRGRRYALLPFLYDEAGARLREENMKYVAPEIAGYRADPTEAAA